MPEVHYKFKSSLSFEVIKFSELSITVGVLKDLINQKQSIKTSGFDLKLKDTQGKTYIDDDEIIDLKSKIIVSRVPKIPKTQINTKKKETNSATNVCDIPIVSSNLEKVVNQPEEKSDGELTKVDSLSEKVEQIIPDILKCCLCNQLMKDSMQIKCCKKNYCHECITGYLFDPDISGSLECPDCKSIVSIKDANLTNNLKIRNMVFDFQNGKLDSNKTDEREIIEPAEDLLMHLENVHEVEISGEDLNNPDNDIPGKSSENVDSSQPDEVLIPDNSSNYKETIDQDQNSPNESVIHPNTISPADISESVTDYPNVKNQNNYPTEINQIEQHYQGRNYTNPISVDQQLTNKSGIPVINTSSIPNVKNNSSNKDLSNPSIHDLDFDPVMYMTFLKIVGENCPDELRKILSNNNESLNISKDSRKTSSSTRRSRDDDYHEKHISKKSRYDMEIEEPRYKKTYNPIDRHSEHRYYENMEKKSNRMRSRSKEYYQKKPDGYSSNKRSRDYEMPRDRDYYPSNNNNNNNNNNSNVPRYRNSENQNNYQDDRHKYRPNYNSSLNRIKSTKYKRPMDR